MISLKKNKKNFKRGILLLEVVVSLGIFISIMVIGMGALLTMYGTNQKSQSLKTVMNNLSFALDSMSREIAVVGKKRESSPGVTNQEGSSLRCGVSSFPSGDLDIPQDCDAGGMYITFCNFTGDRISYRFNGTDESIERVFTSDGSECPDSVDLNAWERVTAQEVTINNMMFYVSGTEDVDKQPKVLISIDGEAGTKDNTKSKFEIQTTLSQRIPDLSILFVP